MRQSSGGPRSSRCGTTWADDRRAHASADRSRRSAHPLARLGRRVERRRHPRARGTGRPRRDRDHRPRADRCGPRGPSDCRGTRDARPSGPRRGDFDARRPRARPVHREAHQAVGIVALGDRPDPRAGRPRDRRPPARPVSVDVRQRALDPKGSSTTRIHWFTQTASRHSTRPRPEHDGAAARRSSLQTWAWPRWRAATRTAPRTWARPSPPSTARPRPTSGAPSRRARRPGTGANTAGRDRLRLSAATGQVRRGRSGQCRRQGQARRNRARPRLPGRTAAACAAR